ncbi:hypothetical protein GCM10023321_69880 [Pseudonocardia eucalypti]|uniref:Uncharacterized protein n=1 Tax=Pseudonocardia eucalypti TaxID=648755 RepID=A0ABP9R4D0_9PSEU|nr:hypothetical protein [Pseudonocardia eucalypti]
MYRLVQDRAVLEQLEALPIEALSSYAEALAVLEVAPAGGRPYNQDKPDGPMYELVFGPAGEGAITYLLLEREREVHVLLIQWAG